MNILLVSQCDKRALSESRRILDQFAERRGDRTWQTPITQDGLDTLRRLLRKTARKNTAVACHWIRGRDHSELMWIVGDARRFNAEGAVPTNTTARDVLRRHDENDWHTARDIRLLAQLAALLHDLGKASVAFQQRLEGRLTERNRYRHEWVSLRLFQAFVGRDDDSGWLARLADPGAVNEQDWIASGRYLRDGLDDADPHPFRQLPPLAAAVAWLVLTHHRLPVVPVDRPDGSQDWQGRRASRFDPSWLANPLHGVAHDWNEIRQAATRDQVAPYWLLAASLPVTSQPWRTQAARVARSLQDLCLRRARSQSWLGNAYVMHLARLSLMLADHHYSSLGVDAEGRPVHERRPFIHDAEPPTAPKGDSPPPRVLAANTRRAPHGRSVPNQTLAEHLLGVGHAAGLIAHALPGFERHLPRLAHHRGLRKRSAVARFGWQDKAFDAAASLREAAREHGAFVVNMASTGCGKTLANVRILYALADPQLGLRATYALGLRTLTLQTGRSLRHDLHLDEDDLAVRVGGSANRSLFEHYEQQAEISGSASIQALIEEDSHVHYDGSLADHPLLSRALADAEIRKLLSAPVLVCTVDHLAPATESLRAGRQIAPMLRLMSADLILDELDDYDLNDLPALTRLVHWAGLLGSRIVLSSATLPPALVEGMFTAYRTGRAQYLRNRGEAGCSDTPRLDVACLWADEFGVQADRCGDAVAFARTHHAFVQQRVSRLQLAPALRRVELLPFAPTSNRPDVVRRAFALHIRDACLRLHDAHAHTDPISGKRVSFGLVRMANIDPLVDVACTLHALGAPDGKQIHLCVYHARFPLLQRSAIEFMLDGVLNRRDPQAVWHLPQVRRALDPYEQQDQVFVVLASPVCEVGRDWDADWAVAEPSSMRALIQLGGRVQRHRRLAGDAPNLLLFDTNLKHVERRNPGDPAFSRPGFETSRHGRFPLDSHSLSRLLVEEEYRRLDAVPRIQPRPVSDRLPRQRWVDLEHARMDACMQPLVAPVAARSTSRRAATAPSLERDQAAPAWQFPQAALTGVLQQQQRFRDDNQRRTLLAFLPDETEESLVIHRVEEDPARRGSKLYIAASELLHRLQLDSTSGLAPWGEFDLMALLVEQAEVAELTLQETASRFASLEVPHSDQGWRWHPWLGLTPQR